MSHLVMNDCHNGRHALGRFICVIYHLYSVDFGGVVCWWPINFVLSCRIAGTVGGAATCPLDVAKTRLQSSLIAAGHMQTRPTLNVAGDGLTATLNASLHRPQCGRTTVSIGFYHCIRWTSEVTFLTSAESTFWYLADTWWCCLALWQGLLQNIQCRSFYLDRMC